MSVIEWIINYPISSIAILLVEYIVIMLLYHRTNRTGAKIAKVLAVPFVVQDFLVNVFAVSLLFLELPQEYLVTARLQRWKRIPQEHGNMKGVRRRFAWFMCDILNRYDPGHC